MVDLVTSKRSIAELGIISILFGILSFTALMSTRLVSRATMHAFRSHGHNLRHLLIVGTNRRADGFARDVALHPEWGYRLQGFVDDQWWYERTADSNQGALLGGFDAIPALLRTLPVDEVIVALPLASFYQHDESWDARASMIKRFADVVISFILLLALAPILLTIAVLIKLTSAGPVFFTQTRMGYGKRPFQILKFRTMVQDAEKLISQVEHLNETQGPTFKLKNDPRITTLEKFLRKTSLDELPQLINVFVGDMSLVGPRPLPLQDYQGFSQDWHRRRFSVKPGITCLWQVMGRSSIGFDEWMALDMRYIDQWSVWLDIKILFQTIPAVFRGSGAV